VSGGSLERVLACRCGDAAFVVRADRQGQAGFVVCSAGHGSLLLDSRDVWFDVLREGRPPVVKCRCKAASFAITLRYALRDDGDVRRVDVDLRCVACGAEKRATSFEIDYGPTDALLTTPLDPCDEPWLAPKRRSLTGLWGPADLERAIELAAPEAERAYLLVFGAPPEALAVADAAHRARQRAADGQAFDVLLGLASDAEPPTVAHAWLTRPFVRVSSPTVMRYATPRGPDLVGHLHYVELAEDAIVRGARVPQPPAFVAFARAYVARLRAAFDGRRWKDAIDAPAEVARLAPAIPSLARP
jgi:hypothetical protein